MASAIAPLAERVIVAARAAAIERQPRIAAPGNQAATAAVARVNSAAAATAAVAAIEAGPIKASIAAEVPPEVPANAVARAGLVPAAAQETVAAAQEVAVVVADAAGRKSSE
ncbi:hypothetical protein I6F37_42710 [Bradyrhizobium sp. NBAIM08]|nr:hypothetical protein [Bradyrhizobium sp. NBAIM08]